MARKNTNTQKKATPKAKIETPIVVSTDLEDFLKVAQQTDDLINTEENAVVEAERIDEIEKPIQEAVEHPETEPIEASTEVGNETDGPIFEEASPTKPKTKKEEKPYVKVQPMRKLYTGSVMGIEGLYGY